MTKTYTVKIINHKADQELAGWKNTTVAEYFSKTDRGWVRCTVLGAERKSTGNIYLKLRRQVDGKVVTIRTDTKPTRVVATHGSPV
jgi:capsid portal protein